MSATAPILNQLPIEVNTECIATDEDGHQCARFTTKGDLCNQHCRALLGLKVRTSTIANAGLGLFTTRAFDRGDLLCQYKGRVMTSAEFKASPSAYGVRLWRGVLDARRSSDGFARYANAAARVREVNAHLIADSKLRKGGSGSVIWLQATKPIPAGTEVLIRYGANYHTEQGNVGLL